MNKEQIEQAAKEDSLWFAIKGDEDKESLYKAAFINGAEWRINSVWHDSKEKPACEGERKFCDIFYISKKGYPRANTFSSNGFLLYKGEEWRDVKYWAYVEDLLPNTKQQ